MSCKNYIERLLKLYGWDTKSPSESISKPESTSTLDEVTGTTLTARDKNYVNQNLNYACDGNEAKSDPLNFPPSFLNIHEPPGSDVSNQTKFLQVSKSSESSGGNDIFAINTSRPVSPLPTDCINQNV